ncbi:unnamed protein product [Meganyctiphanes norvegica]|uniref:Uncharacterized protein n=1 Tax=Meganyctiphanes norvegica TaxID=48144 RepID=A0AAV2QUV3_MEGNR
MLDTFYKQDDGMLEKELPTHVTYSVPAKPALAPVKKTEHVPAVDLWTPSPIVKKNPAPAKEFAPAVYRWTTSPPEKPVRQPKSGIDIVTPAPFVKPKSSDMAVEVVAEAEKPGVSKVEEDSEGYKIEEEELDANPKSEGEEKSVDAGTDVAETEEDEQKAEAKSVDEGTEGAEAEEGEQDIISKSGGEEKSASEGSEGGEAEEDEQDSSARNKGEENSADEAKAKNDITKGEKEEDESEEKRR